MAMPTYVGFINTTVTNSITRAYPAGHAADDIAFFIGQSQSDQATTNNTALPNDAGWTEVTLTNNKTTGSTLFVDAGIRLWWKKLTSSSMPNLALTNAGVGNCWATVIVVRGLPTSGDPYNQIVCNFLDTQSTSVTFPTLTTTNPDCFIINYHNSSFNSNTAQFGSFVNASQANVTSRLQTGSVIGHQVGVFTGEKATAGSISAGTAVLTNANKQVNLIIAAGVPGAAPVTEKIFYGTSGQMYMLKGSKLFNLKSGNFINVKNQTNMIVDLNTGRVYFKIQDNILVDNDN